MIQRIQSIWFLIASLVTTLVHFVPYYKYKLTNGESKSLLVKESLLLFIISSLLILLPLVCIFLYKNRLNQKLVSWISIILNLAFMYLLFMDIKSLAGRLKDQFESGIYQVGAMIPIIAILFLILAISGIRKDQKLLKSADRIR